MQKSNAAVTRSRDLAVRNARPLRVDPRALMATEVDRSLCIRQPGIKGILAGDLRKGTTVDKYTAPHIADSALLTIDTQNDFTLDGAPACIAGTQDVIPKMAHLLRLYRNQNLLIIHIVRLYLPDGSNVDLCRRQSVEEGQKVVAPDSEGAELVQGLKPDSAIQLDSRQLLSGNFQRIGCNEFIMYKPRWGAFFGTRLEAFLKEHEKDTLVFSGCNFPNCPRTSIYEASERDFRIALAKDAMSQLYPKDEDEMKGIGVSVLATNELEQLMT